MKVLIIGLGSAGQRHLRNLKKIIGDDLEVLAYRKRGYGRTFDDKLKVVEGVNVEYTYGIKVFHDINNAFDQKPECVFITNPNSMHMDCALEAAKAGIPMFIEKPLAVNLDNTKELMELVNEKKLLAYVGYQMRFHPCIRKATEILEQGLLGKILYVNVEIGELISKMHEYEDYRDMCESKKETGGGVVLCQIHELDYLYSFFGLPEDVLSIGGKYSNLDIEVEDNATSLFRYSDGDSEFPVVIHQDFLQSPPTRRCRIVGEYGVLEFDILKCHIHLNVNGDNVYDQTFTSFERNDMFINEISHFINSLKNGTKPFVSLNDGMASLKMACAIKQSMEEKTIIKLTNM